MNLSQGSGSTSRPAAAESTHAWEHVSLQPLLCRVVTTMSATSGPSLILTVEWWPNGETGCVVLVRVASISYAGIA